MTQPPVRIVWLAVLAGFFADFIITLIVTLIGQSFDPQLVEGFTLSSNVGVVVTILATCSTVVGGWIAGRLARHEYVLHGALVGGLGLITLALDSLLIMPASLFEIVHAIVLVGAGALGGFISRWVPSPQKNV